MAHGERAGEQLVILITERVLTYMVKHIVVNDLYRKKAATIETTATIQQALHKMDEENTNGLLVMGDDDKLIGILSLQDIAGAIVPEEMQSNSNLAGALFKEGFFEELARKLNRKKVTEVMRTDFKTVTRDASILEIAAEFLQTDLYIVPVVEDGKLLGVVSRTEIRRAMATAMAS